MVIKNGVLMPKQKQRRYRTERPFACEHCSARFTLRSNMERHIKQQHPQFWAQRQRGNHGLMRRGPPPQMGMSSPMMPTLQASGFSGISDQVKYAILAQQLKSRESPKGMCSPPYPMQMPVQTQLTEAPSPPLEKSRTPAMKEDDDDDDQLVIDEDFEGEEMAKSSDAHEKISAARKIAENILEEAMKMGSSHAKTVEINMKESASKEVPTSDSETEKEPEVEVKRESKEEANDLVSVSKLVDNATNSMMFSKYFR